MVVSARRAEGPLLPLIPAAHVDRRDVRMLVVDPTSRRLDIAAFATLPARLAPGDLLVVNDAATLPASLLGVDASGRPLELRLVGPPVGARAWAVLFGPGDHRTRTEDRLAPPALPPGSPVFFGGQDLPPQHLESADESGANAHFGRRSRLRVSSQEANDFNNLGPMILSPSGPSGLGATVRGRSERSERLVEIEFDRDGDGLWSALYRLGRPVQYAHRPEPLALWDVQTVYAGRPWAAEMPSAGRPLTWEVLAPLAARGVRVVALTHAAGLSATGDAALDAALPLPERYDIPAATATAVAETRARGGRIVAVGTSVVRALEAAALAEQGYVRAGVGVAEIVLDEHVRPQVVDGLVSGVHGPGESHYRLLAAFLDAPLLAAMWARAAAAGLATHELGDATLILPSG